MPASANWDHVDSRETFTAEAAKLGFTLEGPDWKHANGAKVYDAMLCDLVASYGPAAYAEMLGRMQEQGRRRG